MSTTHRMLEALTLKELLGRIEERSPYLGRARVREDTAYVGAR